MRHLHENGYDPLLTENYQDFKQHYKEDQKQAILLDNPFGEEQFRYDKYSDWTSCIKKCRRNKGNVLVLCTISDSVLADLKSKVRNPR